MKEEERERIGKINNALEERMKSLSIDTQIWRELAQTNEATANKLRTNLEPLLAQIKDLRNVRRNTADNVNADYDYAQWCCGSSSWKERGRRTVATEPRDKAEKGRKKSRSCGVCWFSVHTCPISRSPKNARVHVNM